MEPIIRIYPTKFVFAIDEDLKSWLYFTLRNRDGYYYMRSVPRTMLDHTPRGSVVMFRHGDKIIGDAIVKHDIMDSNIPAYQSMIKFDAYSVRVYPRPLRLSRVEALIGKTLSMEGRHYMLPITDYGFFLNEMVLDQSQDEKKKYNPKIDGTLAKTKEYPPKVWIFPHTKWFSSMGRFRSWVHFDMKARGGIYHFMRLPKELEESPTPGSVVMLRYDQDIIGEAVVKTKIRKSDDKRYQNEFTLDPFSIRLYKHSLRVPLLERSLKLDIPDPNKYYSLDFSIFGDLMGKVVNRGGFLPG